MRNKALKLFALYLGTIYAVTALVPLAVFTAKPQRAQAGREPAPAFVATAAAIGSAPDKKTSSQNEFRLKDAANGKITTVNSEELLFGSLASEMSPEVPIEALKAQAVASYSYYTHLKAQRSGAEYDLIWNSKLSGVWNTRKSFEKTWGDNFGEYTEKIESAINETKGQTLVYGGEIACSAFFAASSGQTESAADIWGKAYPYLISVASPYDSLASGTETVKEISPEKIKKIMETNWADGKYDFTLPHEKWFSEIEYTIGGSVRSLNVCGFSITGNEAYINFGLASSCFTVEFKDGKFIFKAKGRGHGVGMSQTGAVYMAAEGADYREILNWYYPGTELKEAKK